MYVNEKQILIFLKESSRTQKKNFKIPGQSFPLHVLFELHVHVLLKINLLENIS